MGVDRAVVALFCWSSGRQFRDDRRVAERSIHRYRRGLLWRDVPREFGAWQTLWMRHRRYSGDGNWDQVLAAGVVNWDASVDSTIIRAHQPAANLERPTGGRVELPPQRQLLPPARLLRPSVRKHCPRAVGTLAGYHLGAATATTLAAEEPTVSPRPSAAPG